MRVCFHPREQEYLSGNVTCVSPRGKSLTPRRELYVTQDFFTLPVKTVTRGIMVRARQLATPNDSFSFESIVSFVPLSVAFHGKNIHRFLGLSSLSPTLSLFFFSLPLLSLHDSFCEVCPSTRNITQSPRIYFHTRARVEKI